jgi:TRAP transporter 4TM/12TM fusion protein
MTDKANQAKFSSPVGLAGRFIGEWRVLGTLLCVGCSLYYAWVAAVGITMPALDRSLFIYIGVAVAVCFYPLAHSVPLRLLDVALLVGATAATLHFNLRYEHFMMTAGLGIDPLDVFMGLIITGAVIEAARRVLGLAIPIIAILFFAYLFIGPMVPEPFRHRGFDLETVMSNLYASTDGLYGIITYTLASNLFLFLVFGQFLIRSGASDFYSDLCLSFLGRQTGGGAKAAVASSGIVGSVTGSAAANVAVTGVISIPLMKRSGYPPHIAGATEAAASTGGTILPPIMGAAAFIMVALTGIPYAEVALFAALPAALYFLNVYMQIHFYAHRNGLRGLSEAECPRFWIVLMGGWPLLLPIIVVIFMIYNGYSLSRTGLLAIVSCVVCSWFTNRNRMGPVAIFEALAAGTRHGLSIIAVAGPVSIMTLAILIPGTGLKITGLLITLGGGELAITLAIIFVIGYVLGMGLSMVPAYIILATLAAPALIRLDIPVLAAHFLVMWWSQASNITPPVALAAYVAANVANSPLWKTGNAAVIKGAGLFYIPVLFIYQPGLLFDGTFLSISVTIVSVIVGVVLISAAIEGYLTRTLGMSTRLGYGILGCLMILAHDPMWFVLLLAAITILYLAEGRWGRRALPLVDKGSSKEGGMS